MTSYVTYAKGLAADTNRTPSPAIWANCPIQEIQDDPCFGQYHFNDFLHVEDVAAGATGVNYGLYHVDADAGVTLSAVDATDFGALRVDNNDAANDGSVLVHGVDGGFARFAPGDEVWFEARWRKASITDDALAFFLGFVEVDGANPTADATLTDTDTIPDASEDFIGFWNDGDDGDVVEAIYQEGGATRVNVGDINTAIAANTWYKTGLHFRGQKGQRGILDYYLNGEIVQSVELTSSLSFPDANHLALVWATKSVLTAASTMDLDWIRVASVGGNT